MDEDTLPKIPMTRLEHRYTTIRGLTEQMFIGEKDIRTDEVINTLTLFGYRQRDNEVHTITVGARSNDDLGFKHGNVTEYTPSIRVTFGRNGESAELQKGMYTVIVRWANNNSNEDFIRQVWSVGWVYPDRKSKHGWINLYRRSLARKLRAYRAMIRQYVSEETSGRIEPWSAPVHGRPDKPKRAMRIRLS
jgi:hypothetical protein